jgi:hypothetical protein
MVQQTRRMPVPVFRVYDREGRAIGDVVQPMTVPIMGRGARTVLLVRDKDDGHGARPRGSLLTA